MNHATTDKVRGEVVEELPNATFRVQIAGVGEKICYLAGRMKQAKVNVKLGDVVEVVLDPYGGKATNRIVWRV